MADDSLGFRFTAKDVSVYGGTDSLEELAKFIERLKAIHELFARFKVENASEPEDAS